MNIRLPALVDDTERPMFHVALEFIVVHLTTDETFGVKHGILRVGVESILGRVSDPRLTVSTGRKWMRYGNLQSFVVTKADP